MPFRSSIIIRGRILICARRMHSCVWLHLHAAPMRGLCHRTHDCHISSAFATSLHIWSTSRKKIADILSPFFFSVMPMLLLASNMTESKRHQQFVYCILFRGITATCAGCFFSVRLPNTFELSLCRARLTCKSCYRKIHPTLTVKQRSCIIDS